MKSTSSSRATTRCFLNLSCSSFMNVSALPLHLGHIGLVCFLSILSILHRYVYSSLAYSCPLSVTTSLGTPNT